MKNTETAKQESTQDYNINDIEPYRPRPRFDTDHRGVWWINVRTGKDGEAIEAEPLLLSDPIDIIGTGQDNDGVLPRYPLAGQNHTPTKDRRPATSRNCRWEMLGAFGVLRLIH